MPDEAEKDIPVRVVLRCRPLITKEIAEGCQQCLTFTPGEPQVILGKEKAFTYDFVFGADTAQQHVYKTAVSGLVGGLFKGLNATVLAYGQTGSGKTYSMGNVYNINDETDMGIIPRVIRSLFQGIEERIDTEFLVKVSYLEIYKEDIKDLLSSASAKEPLAIREVTDGGIKVAGLSEVRVQSVEETMRCLEKGAVGRTTASTAMNATSSRSHAIFTVHIDMVKKDDSNDSCHAKFHLVDLAGSERAKKTKAQGERFKEGVNINRGLLALGNVISALGDENGRKGHIPYRDAKLTRLLQDSLGGNSQTVMIACVSPADSNLEETLNTLRYADRARQIKNKPVINRDPNAAELARLKQQVQQLQIQLLQGQSVNGGPLPTCDAGALQGSADLQILLQRNQKLEGENQKLSIELQTAVDQTTHMCEKAILAEMSRDKLKQKLDELRSHADLSISALNTTSADTTDDDQLGDKINILKELQKKIIEVQAQEKIGLRKEDLYGEMGSPASEIAKSDLENEQNQDSTSAASSSISPPTVSGHTLRQAQLGRELQELNKALALKQELADKMGQNDDKMSIIKLQYENNIHQLEGDISTLQKEKEDLLNAFNSAKANTATNKISEQRRKRLKELEEQLSQLKKKLMEQAKMLKLKEKSDQRCTQLNSEIREIKQVRVRLMKQMKQDATKWQQFKTEKDREVMQLKSKERKRQCEFTKMEQQNKKAQMVMRRKVEEASAANKRLKEALLRQKATTAKKEKENNINGIGKRIRGWLDHELDIMVSIKEAKHHLASLLNDRKGISQQLVQLQQKQNDEPPTKKYATPEKGIPIGDQATSKKICELKQELELCNVQIADLQQEIVDADQEDKGKSRWSRLTSMIEAKCGLQFLLEQCVTARVETIKCRGQLQEVKTSLSDASQEMDEVLEEHSKVENEHQQSLTSMQRAYEDKILYLLSQLPNAAAKAENNSPSVNKLNDRLQFQDQVISDMKNVHEQLQQAATENEDLKKQLTLASYSSGSYSTGKKMSLLPKPVSPEILPDSTQTKSKLFKKKSVAKKPAQFENYTIDEYFNDSASEDMSDSDSDWHETPKQKRRTFVKRKRSSLIQMRCYCKTNCKLRCGCRKNNRTCTDHCKCDPEKCTHRSNGDENGSNGEENAFASTLGDTSNVLNTTVTLESRNTFQNSTPVMFKSPLSPPKRSVLTDVNREMSLPASASSTQQPLVKKTFPKGPSYASNGAKDPLSNKVRRPAEGITDQGITHRKRKLLSLSSSSSFFKPLTDS